MIYFLSCFLLGQKLQVRINQNFHKSYNYEDFIPIIDKSMNAPWQNVMENDRYALSKGTLPTYNSASTYMTDSLE